MDIPGIRLERDHAGRIVRRDVALYSTPETKRYAYDAAGRLARVTDGAGALLESYQYDEKGRRRADINPARFRGERRYTYSPGDRLLQAGRVQYGHDTAGFRTLKVEDAGSQPRETRYRYEPSGLLLAVELPGRTIEYAHDSGGMRREKRVDGRLIEAHRWLDPLRLSEFYDGAKWWRLAYDGPGRTPVGLTDGRASFFLYSDHLGTPLALADMDGNIVQTMRYDCFGNLLETRGHAVRLPIGFAGGLFDADTGLTRFVWRDYDADTGRFTALDPLGEKGGDNDWYGYCVDDPVNRVDALGLSAIALPGPFGPPVTPVVIPGTPENDQFTRGTLDFLKGFGDIWGGSDEPDNDPNTYESEHSSNRTPSNREKHEEGQARKQRDKDGEKKNQHPNWRGNRNKRRKDQSDEGSPDSGGFADNGDAEGTEDNA